MIVTDSDNHLLEYQISSEEEFQQTLESLTDKDVAVFSGLGQIPIKNVYADAHIIVMCLEGSGHATIDGKSYDIVKNDVVIGTPDRFVENVMVSCDFECRGVLMSPKYFQTVFYLPGNMWKARFDVRKMPVLHMSPKEADGFMLNYEMLKYKLACTDKPHHKQSLRLFLQSLIYEVYDCFAPKLHLASDARVGYTSAESLFNRFVGMLTAESPCRHPVTFYAAKLCITPKYLSSICKKQAGSTASGLIDQMAVNYIKQMLRSSDKSIKEIASATGFDNLSFFGKFVRRKLGMSPRDYRTNA